jgi:hypothetical protein
MDECNEEVRMLASICISRYVRGMCSVYMSCDPFPCVTCVCMYVCSCEMRHCVLASICIFRYVQLVRLPFD